MDKDIIDQEKLRSEFIQYFTHPKLEIMTLEEYSLNKQENIY